MPTHYLAIIDWEFGWTNSVLQALDRSLFELEGEVRETLGEGGDPDDWNEQRESSAGVALVALQVYIAATTANLTEIDATSPHHMDLIRANGHAVDGVNVDGRALGDIEAFWQLGNYFKHRDEWRAKRVRGGVENHGGATHADLGQGRPDVVAALEALGIRTWSRVGATGGVELGTTFPLVAGVTRILGNSWAFVDILKRALLWRGRCFRALGIPHDDVLEELVLRGG